MSRCIPALLALPAMLAAQAPEPIPAPLLQAWPRLQEWAGGSKAPREFEILKLRDFLQARRTDLRAAQSSAWKPWLEKLATAKPTELAAWAQTRLVEAGAFAAYDGLLATAVEHFEALSQPGSRTAILRQPISGGGWMPGIFRIHSDSPYWVVVEQQVRARPELPVGPNLYAIWCHGTFPAQRSLIYDLAGKIEARPTPRNPKVDPWNDPRFWIVADWAMAWGSADDFRMLADLIPDGPARTAFSRLAEGLKDNPAFWAKAPGVVEMRRLNALLLPGAKSAEADDADRGPLKVLQEGPEPSSPPIAKERGLQTSLSVLLSVDPDGKVAAWRPVPGPWLGPFTSWAGTSVVQYRFEPVKREGVGQWGRTTLTFNFWLRDRRFSPNF